MFIFAFDEIVYEKNSGLWIKVFYGGQDNNLQIGGKAKASFKMCPKQ
jgi:hypothetical protein